MEALLLGLWILSLLLSLGSRRRRADVVVVVPVVLVVPPAEGAPPAEGEAWLRRQLEGLGE